MRNRSHLAAALLISALASGPAAMACHAAAVKTLGGCAAQPMRCDVPGCHATAPGLAMSCCLLSGETPPGASNPQQPTASVDGSSTALLAYRASIPAGRLPADPRQPPDRVLPASASPLLL
jgi:hypothetical protein